MTKRKEFTMTEEQETKLLNAMKPVPYLIVGGVAPRSQQENANTAWAWLGTELGFDPMTVQPNGSDTKNFTAVVLKPSKPPHPTIDIVFDGPPGPVPGRFVEVESPPNTGYNFGEWVEREDGYWVLRIPNPAYEVQT